MVPVPLVAVLAVVRLVAEMLETISLELWAFKLGGIVFGFPLSFYNTS